jgi:enterochelin esterase family protein
MTIASFHRIASLGLLTLAGLPALAAQAPAAAGPPSCEGRGAGAQFQSVEVTPDGRVTFRLCAPKATEVRVGGSDLPQAAGVAMTRDALGLWSGTTTAPIAPDNYRYAFIVDGVTLADPRAATFSRELAGTQSTLEVPGPAGAFQAYDQNVAHGSVTEFEYWSKTLGARRRAHVYTPPGYFKSKARYPVLYLVNGAGDSDDNWTSTGHAHYILDNLIASGKAKPMIIVMPAGHTPPRANPLPLGANTDFGDDLLKELIPTIDATFRTRDRARSRAMAGLSMGGAHTLQFGLTHPEIFQYIGIFSMGLGNNGNQQEIARYEQTNAAALARSARELKLVYYAMGTGDFLHATVAPTRAMLDRQHIAHIYNETDGGHTWINWRRYLADFLPRLF